LDWILTHTDLISGEIGMKQKDKVAKRIDMSNLIIDNGKRDWMI
jgi:hypothetical protein